MNGRTLKFYAGVAAIGILADLALYQYAERTKSTDAGRSLRDHYAHNGAFKIAAAGAVTLMVVVALKDWWHDRSQTIS